MAYLKTGRSYSSVAAELGRSVATISRELKRNRRTNGYYTPGVADQYARARRRRQRRGSHYTQAEWQVVLTLLRYKFSPEQISGTLKRFGLFRISHETIYRYLLHDRRHGGVNYRHLRIVPKRRRKRYKSKDSRGILPGKRSITERPSVINDRVELGHWEGDTVIGSDRRHCIVTLVERVTGYVIIKKCVARTVKEINAACRAAIAEHGRLFRTITFDNGTEFHGYKVLEAEFGIRRYFATPYHSWERGTNEHTNGLIRQYLPKKLSFASVTQAHCDQIAQALNSRPRKRHGYRTPAELYSGSDPSLHLMVEPKFIDLLL